MEKQLYLYDSKTGLGDFVPHTDFSTFENLILSFYNDTSPKDPTSEMDLIPDLINEEIPVNKKLARFLDLRDQGFLYCRTPEEAELVQPYGQAVTFDLLAGDIVLIYSPSKYSEETVSGYYLAVIADSETHDAIILDGLDAKFQGLDSNLIYLTKTDIVYVIKEAFEIPSCRNL